MGMYFIFICWIIILSGIFSDVYLDCRRNFSKWRTKLLLSFTRGREDIFEHSTQWKLTAAKVLLEILNDLLQWKRWLWYARILACMCVCMHMCLCDYREIGDNYSYSPAFERVISKIQSKDNKKLQPKQGD